VPYWEWGAGGHKLGAALVAQLKSGRA